MDLLWKKDASGSYTDIFAKVNKKFVRMAVDLRMTLGVVQNKKDNEKSTKLRRLGNDKFKEKNWYLALTHYNQSLRFAEIGTEYVGLAYANRSACFLELEMYEKCLIDIQLAIDANYPQRLRSKLETRRSICSERMQNSQPASSIAPKLDFAADNNFSGMANVIKMEYNEKFGRHFIATCDIDVGKVIMVEKPFTTTAIMKRDKNICDACFKHSMNFIACPFCTYGLFCSQTCAGDFLHVSRCGRGTDADILLVEYTLRSIMFVKSNIPNLREFVEQVVSEQRDQKVIPRTLNDMESRYRLFLKLNLWTSEAEELKLIESAFSTFETMRKKFSDLFEEDQMTTFFMHLCVMHTHLIFCNSFHTQTLGGIFLLRNHFNHSCAPNVLGSFYENHAIATTSRRIKKGDQVFISYGKDYFFEPLQKRQEKMFHDFGFHCDCEKCKHVNWPIYSDQIKEDPDFVDLERAEDVMKTFDIKEIISLKKKCLGILLRYSDLPWCVELDKASYLYQYLSVETLY